MRALAPVRGGEVASRVLVTARCLRQAHLDSHGESAHGGGSHEILLLDAAQLSGTRVPALDLAADRYLRRSAAIDSKKQSAPMWSSCLSTHDIGTKEAQGAPSLACSFASASVTAVAVCRGRCL